MSTFSLLFLQISSYSIDPETRHKLNDEIQQLYIESHYLTITTDILTPELIKLHEQQKEEKAFWADVAPSDDEIKQPVIESVKKPEPREIPKRRIVIPVNKSKLLTLRLKSGEEVKATKDLLLRLRQKLGHKKQPAENGDISVFKIQSALPPKVIHVPFSDRLSPALRRLSSTSSTSGSSPLKKTRNGKIAKSVKLRAALDKSTIAWSSTTKVRPKQTLLDHLNALALQIPSPPDDQSNLKKSTECQAQIPTEDKNLSQASKLVPVVMKWKRCSANTKLLPLSAALKLINNATTNGQMTNGDNNDVGGNSTFH